MTIPNGAAGVDTAGGIFLTSANGHGDLSIADLTGQSQDIVTSALKDKFITNGTSVWSNPTGPLAGVFGGFAGIPGLLAALFGKLLGIDPAGLAGIGNLLTGLEQLLGVTQFQQFIDLLFGGLTGTSSTGNDPAAIVFALLNPLVTIPTQTFDQLWAAIAQLLSGQQAQLNNAGAVLTDDFATVGVGGYTNITGTLAVSSAGPYIQTPNLAVAYRTTGPATNQHGGQIVIDGNQQGWCGVGICSDTAATSYALLQVYSGFEGDAVRLLTGSEPTIAAIQAQTDFITPIRLADTDTFDAWYETATNTVHVLRNAQKVFDWVDTDNILIHDASHRRVLVFSNGEDDTENGSYGPGIRKLQAYDHS